MASLPVTRYRRCSKDTTRDSNIFGNDFELFDPWRDRHVDTAGSLRWIKQPKQHTEFEEKVAPALESPVYGDKYRVKLDIADLDPDTIETTIEGRLLIIEAKKKHHHKNTADEKERKMYDLPESVYEHAGKIDGHPLKSFTLNI